MNPVHPGQPARRRPSVVLLAVLVAALVLTAAVLVATRLTDDGREDPVLVVYGYNGSADEMETLADAITASGRDVTIVDLPDDNTGNLWDSAWTLGQTAEEVMARTDSDSVDVVAHSAGGIVTRLWVSTTEADVVRRVVTMGSPHHGSDGAAIFDPCLEACQQLTPGSDFLEELGREDETPGEASWVSLWSENDGAVEPPESSEIEGALNISVQSVCDGAQINHTQLLSDPLSVNMAVAEVNADERIEFGPGDCERLSGT